jgi:hypothetical protein
MKSLISRLLAPMSSSSLQIRRRRRNREEVIDFLVCLGGKRKIEDISIWEDSYNYYGVARFFAGLPNAKDVISNIDSATTISAPKSQYHVEYHFTSTSSHQLHLMQWMTSMFILEKLGDL